MKNKAIENVKVGEIIRSGNNMYMIKFIDSNPKTVYLKSHEGKALSYPKGHIVEVY